jgi:rod shape-determining protein MreC
MASDVHAGDKLLTSGLGGRFPPGFPVGEILSVDQSPSGMFLEARARPTADLDRSEDVLLLHDQAEPAGPPEPGAPAGPPADLAPVTPAVPASSAPPPRSAEARVSPAPAASAAPVQP